MRLAAASLTRLTECRTYSRKVATWKPAPCTILSKSCRCAGLIHYFLGKYFAPRTLKNGSGFHVYIFACNKANDTRVKPKECAEKEGAKVVFSPNRTMRLFAFIGTFMVFASKKQCAAVRIHLGAIIEAPHRNAS